jgi:dTDP-4-dehydrorhamnose reductase
MPAPIRRSGGGSGGRYGGGATAVGSSAMVGSFRVGQGSLGSLTDLSSRHDVSEVQRLLVTGGCGYLGRELVRLASGRGHEVRATWLHARPRADADWVQADVRDPAAMRAAVAGCGAVIHTAYVQGEGAWEVNADGSLAVAEAARDVRLVHLSTDLVFDGRRGRYHEDDAPAPLNDYGRSKAEAETRVRRSHPEALLVRTSLLYGGAEPGPQERLAREHTRFFVDELRSPVHVVDLADALLELVGLDVSGPLHLGGADDVSRFDFAVLLGADPERLEAAHTTPDRPADVTLDSSRAAALLSTRLRGVREVL